MATVLTNPLQEQALLALGAVDRTQSTWKVKAVNLLRKQPDVSSLPLRDVVSALNWASQQEPINLDRYVVGASDQCKVFRFPNGRTVSVGPDPSALFRFEAWDHASGALANGLTSEQVETHLYRLAVTPN